MTARRLFLFAFAGALFVGVGCSNDPAPTGPGLFCSDGGSAPSNVVNTSCGALLDTQTEFVDIVMGGPGAGTTTLRGINVDVTHDPTKLTFLPSATYTSPTFPSALIAVSSTGAGRVIVSVQQPGNLPAVAVGPGQNVLLSLSFRRVASATFPPSPISFENTEATSPSVPITFTSATAIAYQ